MAVRPQTLKLYQDVRAEFDRMSNVRELGVKKFSVEYIITSIANKFYKSPKTIENIVFNRVATKEQSSSSQGSLF